MNNETYAITKKQRDEWIAIMRKNLENPDAYDAIAELESLPLITGEAKAWLIKFKDTDGTQRSRSYTHNAIGDYRNIDPNATSEELFTQAQPLQPITEADITEAMKEQFLKTPHYASSKDVFIAAVNAYLAAIAGKAT